MKIVMNPNNFVACDILKRLKENNGYCPCSLIKNEDTKCMCKEFREQSTEGYCYCGLYYKSNN